MTDRCSECNRTLVYIRIKKRERVCRSCGHIEKINGVKHSIPSSRERESSIERLLLNHKYLTERDIRRKIYGRTGLSKSEKAPIHSTLDKLEKSGIATTEGTGPDAVWYLTDDGEEIVRRKICH